MSEIACTVAGACRMIAERTGDQQAAHILQTAGELDRLTAELAKHQPEERVGVCWCNEPKQFVWETEIGGEPWMRWSYELHGKWTILDPGEYCRTCGAHLGADGIARRNADTGLLNALERMVLGSAEHGEEVELDARHEGHGVLLTSWHRLTCDFGSGEHTGADLRAAIRAALDQEVGEDGLH